MRKLLKKVVSIALLLMLTMNCIGCSSDNVKNQVKNVAQSEDKEVKMVKGGTPNNYPNITYGDAFGEFFGSPTWTHFVGVKEQPDEDGDGKPDGQEEQCDIVEFTGDCTYQDVEVKALIQFTLSSDNGTFEASYLSFNEVPQNMFMLVGLLEKVFESFQENHPDTVGDVTKKTEEVESLEQNETNKDTVDTSSNALIDITKNADLYYSTSGAALALRNNKNTTIVTAYTTTSSDTAEILYIGETTKKVKDLGTYDIEGKDGYEANMLTYIDEATIRLQVDGLSLEFISNDKQASAGNYILPNSDSVLLTKNDIAGLSLQQICYAKNEIYARHGRRFNSDELQAYFSNKSWYRGVIPPSDFSDDMLNDIEKKNIEFLNNAEHEIDPNGYQLQ